LKLWPEALSEKIRCACIKFKSIRKHSHLFSQNVVQSSSSLGGFCCSRPRYFPYFSSFYFRLIVIFRQGCVASRGFSEAPRPPLVSSRGRFRCRPRCAVTINVVASSSTSTTSSLQPIADCNKLLCIYL
jgi:hypothetical protein